MDADIDDLLEEVTCSYYSVDDECSKLSRSILASSTEAVSVTTVAAR